MASFDGQENGPSSMISQAREIANEFEVSDNDICRATTHFLKQLNEGLQKDGTSMCQIPSYVTKLPNGSEKGVCLAIDLGGTNLRVCSVDLHGDSTYSLTQSKVTIPRHLMVAKTYKDLFNFIAVQTKAFMEKHHKPDLEKWAALLQEDTITEEIRLKHTKSLGFTFSFTFDQLALNKGTLLYWTKSFDIPDAVGRDPCAMLQEALDEQNLPLSVTALANDTVGTLAARAYTSPGRSTTVVGAIFGTGTNGAYMERISRITKLHSLQRTSSYEPGALMALNTEWGGFDNKLEVLPTTRFDRDLDRESVNPDDQHFEKRISGMYLGELLRRVLLHMMEPKRNTFDMKISAKSRLHELDGVDSSLLSSVLRDSTESLAVARDEISRALGATEVSASDAQAIRILSEAIGRRAARLSSVAIAGVAIQSGKLGSTDIVKPLATSWGLGFNVLTLFLCGMRGLWNTLAGWLHVKIRVKIPIKGLSGPFSDLAIHGASPVATHEGDIDIGVDGSLIEHFPNFEHNIREALKNIPQVGTSGEKRVKIGMASDGSGVGAALIAWAART